MTDASAAGAFVPGHVTAFFSVHRRDDPARTGSRGAGVVLGQGVELWLRPEAEPGVAVNGEPVDPGPVATVLDAMGVAGRVRAHTPLPHGAGFGVSGALALGTALAANDLADRPRSANELVRLAHRAEVEAGTGLGDVVAQARGGVPIRLEPGPPPHGDLDGVPAGGPVEYVVFDELDTGAVIGGDTGTLTAAGESALERLRERPTLETLFEAARSFGREADLVTPRVASAIEDVRETGGEACMAMLGETVLALDTGLSDAGYDATRTRIRPAGAVPPTDSGGARE